MKTISPVWSISILLQCSLFMNTVLLIFSFDMVSTLSSPVQPEPFYLNPGKAFAIEKLPESRPLQIPPPPPSETFSQSTHHRESKLFPYFLVQFPNDPCSNPGGSQHGICVSAPDCRAAKGTVIGRCAQGFGACCQYVKTCGVEGGDIYVRENATVIRAGNGSSSCRFILPKARGICQVRLDLKKFEFGKPMSDGTCTETKVEIMGSNVNMPNLCGNLTGQHFYLSYKTGDADDKIFIYSGESMSSSDAYSIQVKYIRCDSRQLVPPHCTQYYTKKSGQVRSLNWPHQQLNSQEYTVCIADPVAASMSSRRARKLIQQPSQKIQWSTCHSSIYNGTRDFFISGKIGDAQKMTSSEHCDGNDYILIFGGNKQCGNLFRNETISSPPYLLRVKFDEKETTNVGLPLLSEDYNVITVAKPESECKTLDTNETKCVDTSKNLCKCTRVSRRTNSKSSVTDDQGNTGFCLSYKITE